MDDREHLIRSLLPLVKTIARRVRRMIPGADYGDLVGDGSIGAIRAVDGFDPKRNVTLDVYARRIILGHILNGVRRLDPVPERARRELREAEEQRFAIAVKEQRIPTHSEMYAMRPKFQRAYERLQMFRVLSLDTPLPSGMEPPLDRDADPLAIVMQHDRNFQLKRWLQALPSLERQVVRLHYFERRTLRDTAHLLAMKQQRASQLHLNALRTLRSIAHAATHS